VPGNPFEMFARATVPAGCFKQFRSQAHIEFTRADIADHRFAKRYFVLVNAGRGVTGADCCIGPFAGPQMFADDSGASRQYLALDIEIRWHFVAVREFFGMFAAGVQSTQMIERVDRIDKSRSAGRAFVMWLKAIKVRLGFFYSGVQAGK